MTAQERLAAAFHRKNGGDRHCRHDTEGGWPNECVIDRIENIELHDPHMALR